MAAVQTEGALQMQNHQTPSNLQNLSDVLEQQPFRRICGGPVSPVISIPETEKTAIARALEATRGERRRAARMLRIGCVHYALPENETIRFS
jgi:hypothetical protein